MKNQLYNLICSPFTNKKRVPLSSLKYHIFGGCLTEKEKHKGVIKGIGISHRFSFGTTIIDFEQEQLVLKELYDESPVYNILEIKERDAMINIIGKVLYNQPYKNYLEKQERGEISKEFFAPKDSAIDLILKT